MAASGQVLASAGGRGCRVITEVIAAVLSAAAAPSEASSWAGRGDSRDDDVERKLMENMKMVSISIKAI